MANKKKIVREGFITKVSAMYTDKFLLLDSYYFFKISPCLLVGPHSIIPSSRGGNRSSKIMIKDTIHITVGDF